MPGDYTEDEMPTEPFLEIMEIPVGHYMLIADNIALKLTVIDTRTGKEVPMPTFRPAP